MTQPLKSAPPPEAPSQWVWGSLNPFRRDPLEFYRQCAQHSAPILAAQDGLRRVYVISHPEPIRYVLAEQVSNFSPADPGVAWFRRIAPQSLTASEGQDWARARRLSEPIFQPTRLAPALPVMTHIIARWLEGMSDAASVEMVDSLRQLVINIWSNMLCTLETEAEVRAIGQAFSTLLARYDEKPTGPIPTAVTDTLETLLLRIIRDRRRKHVEANDVLAWLLQARDDPSGEGLDDAGARDAMVSAFFEGSEPVAYGVAWALALLAQHPAIAEQVRAELNTRLAGRAPTSADLPRLTYLRQVLDETLRLYPPRWAIYRRTQHADTIAGYALPAQANLVISPYGLHRHPAFWPEAETFDPERFAPAAVAARARDVYLPFGDGARQCIGAPLALMQMQLILAMVLQRFDLTLAPAQTLTPEPRRWLRPRAPLLMHWRAVE